MDARWGGGVPSPLVSLGEVWEAAKTEIYCSLYSVSHATKVNITYYTRDKFVQIKSRASVALLVGYYTADYAMINQRVSEHLLKCLIT